MTPLEKILKNGWNNFTTKQGEEVRITRVSHSGEQEYSTVLKMYTHKTIVELKHVHKKTRTTYMYGHDFEFLGVISS